MNTNVNLREYADIKIHSRETSNLQRTKHITLFSAIPHSAALQHKEFLSKHAQAVDPQRQTKRTKRIFQHKC